MFKGKYPTFAFTLKGHREATVVSVFSARAYLPIVFEKASKSALLYLAT